MNENEKNKNTNNNTNKTLDILNNEFKNNLISLINNSNLPFFIIEYILKSFYDDIRQLSKQELENNLKRINNSNNI